MSWGSSLAGLTLRVRQRSLSPLLLHQASLRLVFRSQLPLFELGTVSLFEVFIPFCYRLTAGPRKIAGIVLSIAGSTSQTWLIRFVPSSCDALILNCSPFLRRLYSFPDLLLLRSLSLENIILTIFCKQLLVTILSVSLLFSGSCLLAAFPKPLPLSRLSALTLH